ncbi:MAG: hypothetical protein E6G94_00325, partial [Alphaproteobacteria bacterium]
MSSVSNWWTSIFGSAAPVAQSFQHDAIVQNVAALQAALANEATIRMYVDKGGGQGQQAAAVNMLRRIAAPTGANPAGLGFSGNTAGGQPRTVEIVYDDGTDGQSTTLANLQALMSLGAQAQGNFAGVAVRLIPRYVPPLPAPAPVRFSFSAATDATSAQDSDFATLLNATWHLRLQPFSIHKPEQLQQQGQAPILLSAEPQLGGESFSLHGFTTPATNLDAAAWAAFIAAAQNNPNQLRRIQVIKAILDGQMGGGGAKLYDVLFTYGIHTTDWRNGRTTQVNAIGLEPTDQLVELTLGVMATQVDPKGAARAGALPAVIVNLDDYWADSHYFAGFSPQNPPADIFVPAKMLLLGGASHSEEIALKSAIPERRTRAMQVRTARTNYLTAVGLGTAAGLANRFLAANDPDVAGIGAQLTALRNGSDSARRVLWVQLAPPLPLALFNALIGRSTLPAVFEGANTANQALNFNNIYYHVSRPRGTDILYPNLPLEARPQAALLRRLQNAANQVGRMLSDWPASTGTFGDPYPPELFAAPILAMRSEAQNGPLHSYFAGMSAFFQNPDNDKYSLAFAFLGLKAQQGGQQQAMLAAAEGTDPLTALQAALTANLSNGNLKLIPGALDATGAIGKLLGALFSAGGQAWTLSDASVATDPGAAPFTKVTVKGGFSFIGDPLTIEAEFTAPKKVLTATVRITGSVPSLAGVPWVPIDQATLVVELANDGSIPVLSVECALQWPQQVETITLTLPLPFPKTGFTLTGTFDPALSLDVAFKMAGGANPVAQLPAPFSVASKFGLTDAELVYDRAASTIDSGSFKASYNGGPVKLWGPLSLDQLALTFGV